MIGLSELKYQSISKTSESDDNEDYIFIHPSNNQFQTLVALNDGAGGAGVFCKEWAEFLALSLPIKFEDCTKDTENWLTQTSDRFYNNVIKEADLSDLILNKKIYRDGSWSTISVCYLDHNNDSMTYFSVGDSCIFLFEKDQIGYHLRFIDSINNQEEIDSFPKLLNWNKTVQDKIEVKSCSINSTFKIVMASDSLAKWIILQLAITDYNSISKVFKQEFLKSLNQDKYEQRKVSMILRKRFNNIDNILEYLQYIVGNEDIFRNETNLMLGNLEIDLDDYSLIIAEGNVSK